MTLASYHASLLPLPASPQRQSQPFNIHNWLLIGMSRRKIGSFPCIYMQMPVDHRSILLRYMYYMRDCLSRFHHWAVSDFLFHTWFGEHDKINFLLRNKAKTVDFKWFLKFFETSFSPKPCTLKKNRGPSMLICWTLEYYIFFPSMWRRLDFRISWIGN